MALRFRHVAPAGAPIRLVDLVRAARLSVAGTDVATQLAAVFRQKFGVKHSVLTSTGRAGLTLLLRALGRQADSRRDEVILPAYTCFSVAASVVKAGLKVRVVDIDPETLDYAPDELNAVDFSRVLSLVATNLYGLPNDLPALQQTAREHRVYLIDDAAQAMGASVGGRWCGTWGDAGLFSLDKGKNVAAIDGGVVVADGDEVGLAMKREIGSLPAPSTAETAVHMVKAVAYCALLRPWLYWIPNSIPQLGLGQTLFTTEFPLEKPSRPLTALGVVMTGHLEDFTRARVATATAFVRGLRDIPGIRLIAPRPDAVPVYLRLPIILADEQTRRRAVDGLIAAGIGASGSYPTALVDVPGLQPFLAGPVRRARGGRHVAQRILTLPTHAFMRSGDVARAIDVLARTAESVPAQAVGVLSAR